MSHHCAPPAPTGLDLDAVATWLCPRVGGLSGPLRGSLIAGGRSNLTYAIGDGSRTWVLRRPPLANLLPTAHDMSREYRVITALADTAVPVPTTIGLCTDSGVTGAPFFVMERVTGVIIRDAIPTAYADSAPTRRALSQALVDVLVRLHDVDPARVHLGDLGRPEQYLERQLRRWTRQWQLSRTRDLSTIEELQRRLQSSLPQQSQPGLVHGDYRLDNVMFAPADPSSVVAVLDWEMCTLGDPLADLGLLLVYWSDPDHPVQASAVSSTLLTAQPGFMRGEELVQAYARQSRRELGGLEWYVALGFYKLAIVAEGIHARFLAGMTVGEGFETMGDAVPHLVEVALERAGRSQIAGLRG